MTASCTRVFRPWGSTSKIFLLNILKSYYAQVESPTKTQGATGIVRVRTDDRLQVLYMKASIERNFRGNGKLPAILVSQYFER